MFGGLEYEAGRAVLNSLKFVKQTLLRVGVLSRMSSLDW